MPAPDTTMSRRTFVQAVGAATATVAVPAAVATAGSAAPEERAEKPVPLSDDPERYCERGGTSLTVEQLNAIRRELVDAANGYTKDDGTEVPAVWHKLNVLIDTYGRGGPDPTVGDAIDYLLMIFDNDEAAAQNYLEMPWGRLFTAYEYAQESGKGPQECIEICDDLARRGLLYRAQHGSFTNYHHLAFVHGFWEQSIPRLYQPEVLGATLKNLLGTKTGPNMAEVGTPIYYSIPCDADIVTDDRVLPLNDYRVMLERHDKIVLLPCCCSLRQNLVLGEEVPPIGSDEMREYRNVYDSNVYGEGHPLERCLAFGEEAGYYVMIGAGREITKEEAAAVIERSVDEGMVLQMGYTNNSEFICSCHSDCCGVLGSYRMLDTETWNASPIKHNVSNYLLEYDKDACLQCGACIERCPMVAISMDDEGYPAVDDFCVRCGQCGLVCPAGARTLTVRPAEDRLPVPANHMDDHNRKFGYRVEHGLI